MVITRLRVAAAIAAALMANLASAAVLNGTVKDGSGGAVAAATVTILTTQQAVVATTMTDGSGAFSVQNMVPGEYVVRVDASGFRPQQVGVRYTDGMGAIEITLDVAALEEEVTVTASPGIAEDSVRALQPVSVISRDDIQRRVGTVVAQAVSEEAGVHLQQTSPTMAGIFIRGLTGNKVNVFVDGVRYSNGAQRGGVNTFFNLIDQSAVDTIEIVHGPSSAAYGSDALGGTAQLLTRTPLLATTGSSRVHAEIGLAAQTGHRAGGGDAAVNYGRSTFGLFASGAFRSVGEIRTGDGIDSHAAVTRFLGVPSNVLMDDRLPDTGFQQANGMVKANWTPNSRTQFVANYTGTRQDHGDRYDQLLGGDGNLISQLNDMRLDLFYARVERSEVGWFEHGSLTYSVNSQREERVNQGGNGSNTAAIGHEPERTTVHGFQGILSRTLSDRQSLQIGGDVHLEGLTSDAFNVNPVNGAVSPRRPRVPSHATFHQGGAYAQTAYAAIPDRLRLAGSVRVGHASYTAHAADAPIVGGKPLWPDDSFSTTSVTFRAGAIITPKEPWTFSTSLSRGFRAPHMTDLGTLGLTGSGFEVAAPDVAGRSATVGTTADATATTTGDPVEQLVPESSFNLDGSVRYRTRRVRADFTVFVNHIYDNIQKQTLILPQGATGTTLGTEVITSQNANGAVFVAATTTPVLVRANFDNARSWGIEHKGLVQITNNWRLQTTFTYYNVRDTKTNLAPNIEGGIPAPDGYVLLQYTAPGGRWWVQPYLHAAGEQTHLSTLDLSDRRTAAPRNRNSIRAFFLNGATNRGWVSPGADGALGTADDLLTATGENLAQIQDRVLGAGVNSGVLFSAVQSYVALGARGGMQFGRHSILVDLSNLSDRNYRGISWGIDAPGRGIAVKYAARF
jgi:outer membrane receptor for ferrienterochelin and colicin